MTVLHGHESEPSEATPLLRSAARLPERTPLPIRQLLVLACIRLAEPVNFKIIFPFINEVLFPKQHRHRNFNIVVDDRASESNRQAIRDRVLLWIGGMYMFCRELR
jgi:hypothetical protein